MDGQCLADSADLFLGGVADVNPPCVPLQTFGISRQGGLLDEQALPSGRGDDLLGPTGKVGKPVESLRVHSVSPD